MLAQGTQTVIVTLGANGALIVNQEVTKHIPAFQVDVVDTTAAGDAFIGGFASALLQDKPLGEAVRYGCACGAWRQQNSAPSHPCQPKQEVEGFMSL